MSENIEDLSYEETIKKIEKVTAYLEDQTISLDASIQAYAYGTKLTHHAKKLINFAEAKIKNVISKERENDSDQRFKSEDIFDWV